MNVDFKEIIRVNFYHLNNRIVVSFVLLFFFTATDAGRNGEAEPEGERECIEDESDTESEQTDKGNENQDNQDEDSKIPAKYERFHSFLCDATEQSSFFHSFKLSDEEDNEITTENSSFYLWKILTVVIFAISIITYYSFQKYF